MPKLPTGDLTKNMDEFPSLKSKRGSASKDDKTGKDNEKGDFN